MQDSTPLYQRLHAVYVSLTGLHVPFSMPRLFSWEHFVGTGHNEADLILVVRHILGRIKEKRRQPVSLRFTNLIMDIERFDEDLAEARALSRRPFVDHSRERVLRSTGRGIPVIAETVRSAAQILAGIKAAEEFSALKNTL